MTVGWGAYVAFLAVMLILSISLLRHRRPPGLFFALYGSSRAFGNTRGPFPDMASAAPARSGEWGGPSLTRRTRPLSRDYGGDTRSAELAESIGRHQRVLISEHEGAMLRYIAEFDRTEAWRGDGSLSMRDWLVAHCHVGRARARTLVESAGRVEQLPALAGALSAGRLTLDVFAPLATVATSEDRRRPGAGVGALDAPAGPGTGRRGQGDVGRRRGPAKFQRRYVRFDDARCMLWAQLTGDVYALVKSAVLGRARRHDHPSAADPDYVRFESRCADALLDICIEQGRRKTTSRSAAPVHGGGRTTMYCSTDLERLLHGDGYGHVSIQGVGPVSAEVARRLACNVDITLSFDGPYGSSLDQKQLQRDPSEAQRIEIRRRDNGCRFPGCGCRNVTDVHHVVWASKQGPTVMSNLDPLRGPSQPGAPTGLEDGR